VLAVMATCFLRRGKVSHMYGEPLDAIDMASQLTSLIIVTFMLFLFFFFFFDRLGFPHIYPHIWANTIQKQNKMLTEK